MDNAKKARTWIPLWLALGIALGIFIGSRYAKFGHSGRVDGTGKLDAVFNYVEKSYVDTVNVRELVEDALPQILQQLDPHSEYISALNMQSVDEKLEGHFSGIGVSFYVLNDTIVVTSIIPGGPSEAAGIKQWDRIITVNDSVVAGVGITNDGVFKALRGLRNSEVTLGVLRQDIPEKMNITITRGDIPTKSVPAAFMLTDRVGFIKVSTFGFQTFNEFITAISELKLRGATGYIIDLRGNFGGSLDIVVGMVNEFLAKDDLIVYAEGRSFPRKDYAANGSGTCKTDDVVILIDEMSASASEIFAAAIQDHDRGLVIGRRSFGKGLVQSQSKFPDGSAVRLTVARYYAPSGRSIQRKYEKGKYAEYEMEALNRYMKGDYADTDSISNLETFQTLGGRTVYGGDGVMPDIFIPRDSVGYNSYFSSLVNRDLIREYAMMYADMNQHKLENMETVDEMYSYLRRQPLLLNVVSYADNKGIRRRPYYIQESSDLIENQLYAYIAQNFFNEYGFYAVIVKDDDVVKRAVALLETDKASPAAVKSKAYAN